METATLDFVYSHYKFVTGIRRSYEEVTHTARAIIFPFLILSIPCITVLFEKLPVSKLVKKILAYDLFFKSSVTVFTAGCYRIIP